MGIDARILLRLQGEAPSRDQLIDWSARLCTSIGAGKFFFNAEAGETAIRLTHDWEEDKPSGKVYQQDGPELLATPNETFLEVSIWSRYYGPGYERGDILSICAIAEWVERNIPNCQVWYGGDSSGVLAEPFGKAEREAMLAHFYSPKSRDYFTKPLGSMTQERDLYPTGLPCPICPKDNVLPCNGWGNGYAQYHCAPCGRTFVTHDAGITWQIEKGD